MTDAIRHRGPDDEGQWIDGDAGIALGHRRLSILDLSPLGAQPMQSASGRYVVVFNGEIYNYRELRSTLEKAAVRFRGHSDTEILLAAVEAWGLEATLKRCVGMFAIALWDREERELSLARDRLGEKPLYYGTMGTTLLFGSELKALRAHPAWRGEVDRGALAQYMFRSYVPASHCIYRDVHKVKPGTIITLRSPTGDVVEHSYWSAEAVARQGTQHPLSGGENELANELDLLLRRAVSEQMVADVPVGAFLSGGIDSSLIVALMQAQSPRPVRTFTIGFHEEQFNEADHGKAVAKHLGTQHTELYVSPTEAMQVVPTLADTYDEPFADASQIPTMLVSALARRDVTVSLSGDGADELFGGYHRYFRGRNLWNAVRPMPWAARRVAAAGLHGVPQERWTAMVRAAGRFAPSALRVESPGHRIHNIASVLAVRTPETMYDRLTSSWPNAWEVVLGAGPMPKNSDALMFRALGDMNAWMMYRDLVTYLPDDILVKVDRASMAVSLESRAPFLDHRVAEFAWRLPMQAKIQGSKGKRILRQLLYRYVPQALVDRPKKGFSVPVDAWIRGPLRDWAESLLDARRLKEAGYFAPGAIREKWREHLEGRRDWQSMLWCALMFESWRESG